MIVGSRALLGHVRDGARGGVRARLRPVDNRRAPVRYDVTELRGGLSLMTGEIGCGKTPRWTVPGAGVRVPDERGRRQGPGFDEARVATARLREEIGLVMNFEVGVTQHVHVVAAFVAAVADDRA